MPNRSSQFAVLFVVAAGLGLAACASHTAPPVFSTQSPADPKAPAAPPTRVEPLGQPAATPSPGSVKPPAGGSATPAQGSAPAVYTCPMHAHVKSERPGSCPVCGMSLVKAKAKQ